MRDLRKAERGAARTQVISALRRLEATPRSSQLDIKAVEGHAPWLRLRSGDWRILFRDLEDGRIWVERIVNRRDLEVAVKTLA